MAETLSGIETRLYSALLNSSGSKMAETLSGIEAHVTIANEIEKLQSMQTRTKDWSFYD